MKFVTSLLIDAEITIKNAKMSFIIIRQTGEKYVYGHITYEPDYLHINNGHYSYSDQYTLFINRQPILADSHLQPLLEYVTKNTYFRITEEMLNQFQAQCMLKELKSTNN